MSAELLKRGNESYLLAEEIQRSPTVLYYMLLREIPVIVLFFRPNKDEGVKFFSALGSVGSQFCVD
jgi:hypothetical protein